MTILRRIGERAFRAIGPAARAAGKVVALALALLVARWAVYGVDTLELALTVLGSIFVLAFVVSYLGALAGLR